MMGYVLYLDALQFSTQLEHMHQVHEEGGYDRRGAQRGNSLGDQAMESTRL